MTKLIISILFIFIIINLESKEFKLKDIVFIEQESIYLKDLTDTKIPVQYQNFYIGKAPFKKDEKIINSAQIESNLKNSGLIDWAPQTGQTIIKNQTKTLTKQEIINLINTKLDELLHDEKYSYELTSEIKDIYYPKRTTARITLENRIKIRKSGPLQLSLIIVIDKKEYLNLSITVKIRLFKNVFVSNKVIYKNEKIIDNSVVLKEIEITDIEHDIISNIDELKGFQAKSMILENTVLRKSKLKKIPVINRGQLINLILENDNLSLTITGEALSDYLIGDLGRFKNNFNNKIISAQVKDSQTAAIRR